MHCNMVDMINSLLHLSIWPHLRWWYQCCPDATFAIQAVLCQPGITWRHLSSYVREWRMNQANHLWMHLFFFGVGECGIMQGILSLYLRCGFFLCLETKVHTWMVFRKKSENLFTQKDLPGDMTLKIWILFYTLTVRWSLYLTCVGSYTPDH